jgi:hypothetical protein
MNWIMTLSMLLQREPLSLEDLSTALFARGRYDLEARGELAEDARLCSLGSDLLLKASLQPEPHVLVLRLEQAESALQDVDDGLALQAERALADVLNGRDGWQVRALGLRSLKLDGLADAVEAEVSRFDERLRTRGESLEAIAWMRDEALLTAWNPGNTAWSLVPSWVEAEPRQHPEVRGPSAVRDGELLHVGQGLADAFLEQRVLRALEEDEGLRQRFDELQEDFEAFREAPRNVVHLQVHKHLSHIPKARRLEQRAAAATTTAARYETPDVDALVYTFHDGSELYVQKEQDTPNWVLFLSRERPGEPNDFQGPVVERIQHGQLMIAVTRPGEVHVRYGGTSVQLSLEPIEI